MSNLERYDHAFLTAFSLEAIPEGLKVGVPPAWDSVGHMLLVSELEDVFDILLDPEDIIAFKTYENGKDILNKHGVEL